jgi:hypothetical protein
MTLAQVETEVKGEAYPELSVLEFLPQRRIIVFAPNAP